MIKRILNKLAQVGWKRFPSVVYEYIYFHTGIHKLPKKITSFTYNNTLNNKLFARIFPFQQDPILLLSYPRSGSSWIGEVLSYSPELAYLQEPITQAMQKYHNSFPQISPNRNPETYEHYIKYADSAFAGIPLNGMENSVFHPRDFYFLHSRKQKRLLIKEVNPLAVNFYLNRYTPTLLILLRHPAAIAESYARMGWLDEGWNKFGFEYGKRMKNVIDAAGDYQMKVLIFEQFALNPEQQFSALHKFLGIRMSEKIDMIIERYSKHSQLVYMPYQTKRISKDEINKWRANLPVGVIQQIKEGYLKTNLRFFQEKDDW